MADPIQVASDGAQKAATITASNATASRATDKGTRIQKPGQEMDKNSFLKILVAELSNQDPQNAKDSTAYVAQMAQFAGLEQMANLNTNLNFSNATSLIGKIAAFNTADSMGNQYGGTVRGVFKNSQGVQLNVEITEPKDFLYNQVTKVDGQAVTSPMPAPTSLIGKVVSLTDSLGDKYEGKVTSTYENSKGVQLKVDVKAIKDFLYDAVTDVTDALPASEQAAASKAALDAAAKATEAAKVAEIARIAAIMAAIKAEEDAKAAAGTVPTPIPVIAPGVVPVPANP